jgi:hypothetical protein
LKGVFPFFFLPLSSFGLVFVHPAATQVSPDIVALDGDGQAALSWDLLSQK